MYFEEEGWIIHKNQVGMWHCENDAKNPENDNVFHKLCLCYTQHQTILM